MTKAMSRSISCLLFLFVLISICPLAFAEGAESGVRDGIIVDGGVVFLMSDGTVNVLQNDHFVLIRSVFCSKGLYSTREKLSSAKFLQNQNSSTVFFA